MRTFSLVDVGNCSCIVLFQKIPHSHELCKMDDKLVPRQIFLSPSKCSTSILDVSSSTSLRILCTFSLRLTSTRFASILFTEIILVQFGWKIPLTRYVTIIESGCINAGFRFFSFFALVGKND